MDKVLSARIDEAVLHRLNMLASSLHMSKKAVLEGAIVAFAQKYEAEQEIDILDKTCGAWQRDGSADQLLAEGRQKFRQAMTRHQE